MTAVEWKITRITMIEKAIWAISFFRLRAVTIVSSAEWKYFAGRFITDTHCQMRHICFEICSINSKIYDVLGISIGDTDYGRANQFSGNRILSSWYLLSLTSVYRKSVNTDRKDWRHFQASFLENYIYVYTSRVSNRKYTNSYIFRE